MLVAMTTWDIMKCLLTISRIAVWAPLFTMPGMSAIAHHLCIGGEGIQVLLALHLCRQGVVPVSAGLPEHPALALVAAAMQVPAAEAQDLSGQVLLCSEEASLTTIPQAPPPPTSSPSDVPPPLC